MPYVETEGARVFYTDSGLSGGPAVVFGHGFFLDLSMFAPQVEYLTDLGFRVICWDARCHGSSTVSDPGHRFTYWDLARDTLAVMDHAGVDHATLVGMSQGGYAGLRTALLAPERVGGLVLLDTEAGASTDAEIAAYRRLFDAWTDTTIPLDGLADALAPQLIGGTRADQAPWRMKWYRSDRTAIRLAAECLMHRDSLIGRLGEIACPAVVMRGELDESSTAEKSATLAAGLPNAGEVVTVPGAGHAANWTAPGIVNAAIGVFLEEQVVVGPGRGRGV